MKRRADDWRERMDMKLIGERVWLEERLHRLRDTVSQDLNLKMSLFQKRWRNEEEMRRVQREKPRESGEGSESVQVSGGKQSMMSMNSDRDASCWREIREIKEQFQQSEKERLMMQEVNKNLQLRVDELEEKFRDLQREREEQKIKLEQFKKSEIDREKQILREQQEQICAKEKKVLEEALEQRQELAEQWKKIALDKKTFEEEKLRVESDMERWMEMNEKTLENEMRDRVVLAKEREKIEDQKRQIEEIKAFRELENLREEQEMRLAKEKRKLDKKIKVIEGEVQRERENIEQKKLKIMQDREALENEKEMMKSEELEREQRLTEIMKMKKREMMRKINERKKEMEEEWRVVKTEKVKVAEEWKVIEKDRMIAERKIRKKKMMLEKEENMMRRRREEEASVKDDTLVIMRGEVLWKSEKLEDPSTMIEEDTGYISQQPEESVPVIQHEEKERRKLDKMKKKEQKKRKVLQTRETETQRKKEETEMMQRKSENKKQTEQKRVRVQISRSEVEGQSSDDTASTWTLDDIENEICTVKENKKSAGQKEQRHLVENDEKPEGSKVTSAPEIGEIKTRAKDDEPDLDELERMLYENNETKIQPPVKSLKPVSKPPLKVYPKSHTITAPQEKTNPKKIKAKALNDLDDLDKELDEFEKLLNGV